MAFFMFSVERERCRGLPGTVCTCRVLVFWWGLEGTQHRLERHQ
jgi:hypothetical protein